MAARFVWLGLYRLKSRLEEGHLNWSGQEVDVVRENTFMTLLN